MAASCCVTKYLLITINLILFIASLAVLIIGIVTLANEELILDGLNHFGIDLREVLAVTGFDVASVIQSSAIYLVVLGAIVTTISFLGCCGACCMNKCMLGLYATFMIIVLICQITLCILAIVMPEEFKRKVGELMSEGLKEKFNRDMSFTNDGTVEISVNVEEFSWASLQMELKCCGGQNHLDYAGTFWERTYRYQGEIISAAVVPASCCLLKEGEKLPIVKIDSFADLDGCLRNGTTSAYHSHGCIDSIYEYIDRYAHFIIGISAGIAVIELLMIGISICLCRDAGKKHNAV